jgi:type I restriction enzyme R subunit
MTVSLGNEETLVELPAIEFLRNLPDGYDFIHGSQLTPDQGERDFQSSVILGKRLRQALKRLNPWMSETTVNKAALYLEKAEQLGTDLLAINEAVYNAIVNLSLSLEETVHGQKAFQTVRFIDFDHIEKNDFLVTRQFKIQGPNETIIPDIVIFINGIPVVVLECKSPFLETSGAENIGKQQAFQQLRRYMDGRGRPRPKAPNACSTPTFSPPSSTSTRPTSARSAPAMNTTSSGKTPIRPLLIWSIPTRRRTSCCWEP